MSFGLVPVPLLPPPLNRVKSPDSHVSNIVEIYSPNAPITEKLNRLHEKILRPPAVFLIPNQNVLFGPERAGNSRKMSFLPSTFIGEL